MAAARVSVAHDGASRGSSRSLPSGGAELSPSLQVSEIQRSRLLAAAVGVVDQVGYSNTTVTHITNRARVSRRTFYELFGNREDCLAAMLEHAIELIGAEVSAGVQGDLSWRERVREGLWAILSFFDRQPAIARVCVVQTLRGDGRMLERRAEILTWLASVIDEGRGEGTRAGSAPPLTAEGLVGAAHAILYARLLKPSGEPLTELLNGLMGMIALPYLGPEVARREQARTLPAPPVSHAAEHGREVATPEHSPLESIQMRVTYRTARVLERVAEQPGISNREVADQAGISDQGQMSKLLSRLERLGLIANTGEGHAKGEANAWTLTPTGLQVAQSILVQVPNHLEAA